MYVSPSSLEDLCMDVICNNIETYIYMEKCDLLGDIETNVAYTGKVRFKFKHDDLFLFRELSEKLLTKLDEKKLLSDDLMQLFSAKNTKLTKVRIKEKSLSPESLQILKEHKITDLECIGFTESSISDIIDSVSDWSISHMTSANFEMCSFIDIQRHSLMVKITNLKNLRSLNLTDTELNQTTFKMICEDLKFLEKLNVSDTRITDLNPLLLLRDHLTHLAISDLPFAQNYVETLTQLHQIRHLDLSLFKIKPDDFPDDVPLLRFLQTDTTPLANLHSLDLSGWRAKIHQKWLARFLSTHQKIDFLGLVLNDTIIDTSTTNPSLIIAALDSDTQIKLTLKLYKDRSNYVQRALYNLFQWTNLHPAPRPDLFDHVLPVMATHAEFGVQMAATACLYNLTRGDLSKKIHPKSLSEGVALTLLAMETFPSQFQLQKNALLTLCSDTILQEVNFDRFRCAKLVLDALCEFNDTNTSRMAVAICSILAAKVSTEETSELGAQPAYMAKLLAMVRNRVENFLVDITLKFTLSALWNLTDESAATCAVFLEQDGAMLFLKVLQTFKDECTIETKVLGLLNNIAEVGHLRASLMLDELIGELHLLLKSDNIDVSYFAAGIVAHLASDGADVWRVASYSRDEMLRELETAVGGWKVPESEMVAYRSFRPFFSLLGRRMDWQVQLWAVWAIHHVCTKNPKRYCAMLKEEKGDVLLSNLVEAAGTNGEIWTISVQILEAVAAGYD